MVATIICALCRPTLLGLDPPHCFSTQGHTTPGVLGGWTCGCDCKSEIERLGGGVPLLTRGEQET